MSADPDNSRADLADVPDDPSDPDAAPAAPPVPVLREPRDGVPQPLVDYDRLDALAHAVRHGSGPVALDAERASGYRYSQRAYLVQLRRAGVGTALIDPIALPDLADLQDAMGDAEWILHAATQDLPCLDELGLRPAALFDTELAGRLLGDERVALGTMVEKHLGVGLEKGHSAADWSTRPLPYDWLIYAALDVELLVQLRDVLAAALEDAGKTEWARQEFEAIRVAPRAPGRIDPWRRTSGIHKLRHRRQLALVKALWTARDEYAASRDIAPGRVLPDSAIVEAARVAPTQAADLAALPVFGGPRQRRRLDRWFGALQDAQKLSDDELPPITLGSSDGIPAPSRWRERDPAAAARLARARAAVTELAEQHTVLAQNLLASDVIRRLCWEPPAASDDSVRARLAELGARPWQIEVTAARLTTALIDN
ncbi:MAG TPA: HRDC domain-containing protein [Jatrophihabitans sp.]|uniref:HRDC domain-containing protein n=1 Tax=Jatrophihabitans sp. TaxID=1932789 RepID=UPI002DF9C8DE|nr:HRDC domain-containing protein [Jatrophihabitans sp.]